jgi:hypothetical protein
VLIAWWATVVSWTRLNITLQVHCLSVLLCLQTVWSLPRFISTYYAGIKRGTFTLVLYFTPVGSYWRKVILLIVLFFIFFKFYSWISLTKSLRHIFSQKLPFVSFFGRVSCMLQAAHVWHYIDRWASSHREETRGLCWVKTEIKLVLGNPCWQLLFEET